jgi:hypothetical protein
MLPVVDQVQLERHEALVHRGFNTVIRIRHGIQLVTAASLILVHINQDRLSRGPRRLDRLVPVS